MVELVYASNGASVGDGLRPTRISGNGTKFEILVDAKLERYSEVTPKPAPSPTPPETVELAPGTHTFKGVKLGEADAPHWTAPDRLVNVTIEVLE